MNEVYNPPLLRWGINENEVYEVLVFKKINNVNYVCTDKLLNHTYITSFPGFNSKKDALIKLKENLEDELRYIEKSLTNLESNKNEMLTLLNSINKDLEELRRD